MRVPHYEEIVDPRFTDPGRFETADAILTAELTTLSEKALIHGAFLFGSVSFNDHTPGSDRDLIVAYQGPAYQTEAQVLPQLHKVATTVFRQTGVHLEMTCATVQQFKDGEHSMTDPMLTWLKNQHNMASEGVIGESFVDDMQPQRRPPRTMFTDLEAWIAKAHHTLQKAYLQGEYFTPHESLGHIYSLSHVVTRKMLDALALQERTPEELLESMAKDDILAGLERRYAGGGHLESYHYLKASAQTYYQDFLPLVPQLSAEEYDQLIYAELDANLPIAIHFLTRMQLAQRCARAHLRLLVEPLDEGRYVFSEGDETLRGQPFLPADVKEAILRTS